FTHELACASSDQDVRRTFGEHDQTILARGVSMHGAHELSLGGEWNLADAWKLRIELRSLETAFSRGDDERSFGGISLHHPLAVPLVHLGIIRAVRSGERTL